MRVKFQEDVFLFPKSAPEGLPVEEEFFYPDLEDIAEEAKQHASDFSG